jgi:hypothetical protein
MRKTIYVFALALLTAGAYAQTHEVHVELGQAWGGGSSVDINNDGYLDFYITGNKNNPKPNPDSERWNRMFFYNPATDEYDSVGTNLLVTERSNLDWADIDGDGLVDLIAAEHSFDNYHAGVYKNLGTGQFELLDWPIPSRTVAAAFADFNNDGWMDYVCVSQDSAKSAVMINNGDNTFETTNVDNFGGFRFGLGYVEVLDYNNDGFMDFFVSGNVDNSYLLEGARVMADIFINYDEEPGNFYRANLGKTESNPDGVMYMKANGGVDFADFNSDGWIDFALHGEGGAGTGEPASGDIWTCVSHVYLNTQDGSFVDKPQSAFQPDLRPLGSSGVSTGTIDWNNDGYYDLIITGWNPPTVMTQAAYLYHGDGAGNFTDQGRVPGASETVLLFLDWNADDVLDYLVSGHCWDAMWYAAEEVGRTASVYFNTNTSSPNVKPSAPANLEATVDGSNVELTWDAATDDKTPAASLAYEYFLKDGDGNFVVAPASFVGGDHDGLRKVLKLGNAYLNKFVKLHNLPDGNYTWGVQAIDASYAGSAFATGTFKIGGVSVKDVKTTSMADIYSYDNNLIVRIKSSGKADVAIYNMIGQNIVSKMISGEYSTELPTGVYLVKVASEGKVQINKVFIK